MDDVVAFDRLCRTVYVAGRAGVVGCADAFDLAASLLTARPADRDVSELASLSIGCEQTSRPRMAELALTVLEAIEFVPGFSEEPLWLARIEDALRLVNQDLAASGLCQTCLLRVQEDGPGLTGNAYIETWNGHTGTGQGIFPASGADPVTALTAVAEDAQDAVMQALWSVWPACPVHQIGVNARDRAKAAVWWCAGDGGHSVTAIGEWHGH
ncbi:hypothetical protein OWR29_47660 [Actinoplanes sp. Pm04-4]|uniref:Uncharacterized protein n=1 Tax=Paractinoplanes pyxinae TaxID=2997416 RepID=A0ABT4BJD7_9ACTN|nr:hypothetical protein [Actinoplanes pyxinae]MCY1145725.1 hypothetical protein [Actinoplanes pyxinae]